MSRSDAAPSARTDLEAWRQALGRNRFDRDVCFKRQLRRHLGARYEEWAPRLARVAGATGPEFAAWVHEIGRDAGLPELRRHDADGRPGESVFFHPAYHDVGRVFWGSGVLAELERPGSEVAVGAIAYLLDQHGEAGHACPVACTAGAIKLLQKVGTEDQRSRYLPALLDSDYSRRLHAAQFVTEVQGGSDVGLNDCRAEPAADRPGWYRIRGEKWFCSVADAGLFVVSARHGGELGTKGLGLFLVPREIDGAPNGFSLRRLKSKLGTRSMATGEIEFRCALGEPIGALADGFRNLVAIVLDTSRVHNALAACGLMRGATVEAQLFAERRRAFDRSIIEFPAVQEILARMRLRATTGLLSTFRILVMSDRLETERGDDELASARRIAVMINKYWTSIAGTRTARDGIEILGGNGTIEDFSSMPRLLRDAIVYESWEGTHNTLCAQVLRDFATRRLDAPWLQQLQAEIEEIAHPGLKDEVDLARRLHHDVSGRIERLLKSGPGAAAHIRHVVDRMCELTDWVSLLAQAEWDLANTPDRETIDMLRLYRMTILEPADPQQDSGPARLNRRLSRCS